MPYVVLMKTDDLLLQNQWRSSFKYCQINNNKIWSNFLFSADSLQVVSLADPKIIKKDLKEFIKFVQVGTSFVSKSAEYQDKGKIF